MDASLNLHEIKREADKMEATINKVLALNGGGRYFQTVGTGLPLEQEGNCFRVVRRDGANFNLNNFSEEQ